MHKVIRFLVRAPRYPLLWLIRGYQMTLSPDHGPLKRFFPNGYCKFYPTCSSYTHDSVDKFGITRGLLKGGHRILRCNPWSSGGIDEVK